jgi:hypothetical protein
MHHPRLFKPARIANDENEIQIVDTPKAPETRVSIGFAPIPYQLNRTAVLLFKLSSILRRNIPSIYD